VDISLVPTKTETAKEDEEYSASQKWPWGDFAYRIYRNSILEKHLIGSLPLKVIREIHGDNIKSVNHKARRVVVEYDVPLEIWEDMEFLKKD
jgi:hypothetical protein